MRRIVRAFGPHSENVQRDLFLSGLLKVQRDSYLVALLQRLRDFRQHQMIATGCQLYRRTWFDWQAPLIPRMVMTPLFVAISWTSIFAAASVLPPSKRSEAVPLFSIVR